MPSIIKISSNRSVVIVPKSTVGTILRLGNYTVGQLAAFTVQQLGQL